MSKSPDTMPNVINTRLDQISHLQLLHLRTKLGTTSSFRNLKDESLRLKSARREARFLLSWKICNSATGCSTPPFKLRALVMPGCEHFTQFLSQSDFVKIQTHTHEMQSTERLQSCEGCTEEARELHEAKGPAAAVDAASLSVIH